MKGRWRIYFHPDQADDALVAEAEMAVGGIQADRKPCRHLPPGPMYALDCEWAERPIFGLEPFEMPPPVDRLNPIWLDTMMAMHLRGSVDFCRIVAS